MAKFVTNNINSTFTRLFPFFTLRSLHSRINFDIINFSDITTLQQINKKKTMDS